MTEPIRITYAAGQACPTEADFIGYVRRYTTRWRLAGEDTPSRSFHVELAPSERDTTGRVEVLASGSDPREIVGPDCEAVARALAIALAVMIDPEADLSGNAREPSPAEPPVSSPAPEVPPPAAPRLPPEEPRRPSRRRSVPLVTVEGSVAFTTAVVDGALPVLGATVALAPPSPGPFSWLHPSVAVGVRQSLPRDRDTSGFVTEFIWSAGVLRLCPVRFTGAGDRLELIPCLETHVGLLRASARGTPDARVSTRPWVDLGGSLQATYRVHGPWFVGATFAFVAPYTRYRFELANEASVSQAPPTGVTFGATGGVRF